MTTAHSPKRVLKDQARRMAKILKAAERGDPIADDRFHSIANARENETVSFALVMDDKVLKFTMVWTAIRDAGEKGLADYIYSQMRQPTETVH